jgi:hypothetical protein
LGRGVTGGGGGELNQDASVSQMTDFSLNCVGAILTFF